MAIAHAKTYRWTVKAYMRLFEKGLLPRDARVELIEGEIVQMASQLPPHINAIVMSTRELVLVFRETHFVACQCTGQLNEYSAPEPDFYVVPIARYARENPVDHSDLVMEVSASTLAYDRKTKSSLYAKAGIPEYWILDVRKRQLEVRRGPRPDPSGQFGFSYATLFIVPASASVSPLCRPDLSIAVERLL